MGGGREKREEERREFEYIGQVMCTLHLSL